MAADCVDFVDEDDAGGVLLGLLEHVAHARGADADEHLDEVGAGNGEERHPGLARNGLGQQGLAGAGRADHQHAAGNLAAQLLELARVLEEVDQLGHFLLGFLDAGDIIEGDLDLVGAEHARARLAEAHGAAAAGAALHLAHEVDPHADQQQDREGVDQQLHDQRGFLRQLALEADLVLQQVLHHRAIVRFRADGGELAAVLELAGDVLAGDDDFFDIALRHLVVELGILQRRLHAVAPGKALESQHQRHENDAPEQQIFSQIVQCRTLKTASSTLHPVGGAFRLTLDTTAQHSFAPANKPPGCAAARP